MRVGGAAGNGDGRLVVASSRLPVVLERTERGWSVEPGSGGGW